MFHRAEELMREHGIEVLIFLGDAVDVKVKQDAVNLKRRQREARKQSQSTGIGTKSQQALQLQREENKLERKVISREMKEAEKQKQFDLKQQKRKGA